MENPAQFDIEMLQKSAPYSGAPFAVPHIKQYPPHYIPQQPSMFGAHGSTIPPQFLPQYHAPASRRSNFNHYNRARKEIWCETCEWSFSNITKFEQHKAEHMKCQIDGCSFEGHSRVLTKHLEMHNSCSKLGKLDSAEDITKWREERRKNYPTAKNIELRRKAQEEQKKRGERISESKSRFGERNKKYSKGPRNQFKRRNHPGKPQKAADESTDRKADLNQGVSMFRGTGTIEGYVDVENNVLAKLLSVYGSASESESDEVDVEIKDSKDKDDQKSQEKKESISPCKDVEEKTKLAGEKSEKAAKRKHSKETNSEEMRKPTKIYKGLNYDYLRRRNPPTMLSKLLDKEIRHERNVLLQCVRYVVEKDFLGVEK